MMKHTRILALLATTLWAAGAYAADLQSARAAGQVAEKRSGYIAQVSGGADVKALVAEVNARREAEYQAIAVQKGQKADVVARVAAEEIIQKLSPGSLYEGEGGGWKKR